MYERNAIVIERYFDHIFGYDMKNNIRTNFKEYSELVKSLEEYKDISDEEEAVAQEYDQIANNIRQIQNFQESLELKYKKLQEERENIFKEIDENPEVIDKKLEKINENINVLNGEIRDNSKSYVNIIAEFNEKSATRTTCERNRRRIESDYNKKLNTILDNFKDIGINFIKRAKQFMEEETEPIESELISKIEKNGEKEKIPFNKDVIKKAIALSIDIQKRETSILSNIYEKTNKLFMEIKNNNVKIEKHKKLIQDSNCKINFINAIKEYLVLFLDNERLTVVNGEIEHTKLMKEACKNIEEDLVQVNNLYTLLVKEISNKITKKSYEELYNIEYITNLEKKANQFDIEVKKLKLPVTVINPNYWRIDGMKKIFDVFFNSVTEAYGRDLSEYIENEKIENEIILDEPEELIEQKEIETEEVVEKINKNDDEDIDKNQDIDTTKSEIDRKIDMILGFDENGEVTDIDDEDWDEEDFEDEEDEDEKFEFEENEVEDLDEEDKSIYEEDESNYDEFEEEKDVDFEDEEDDNENDMDFDEEDDEEDYNEYEEDDDSEDESILQNKNDDITFDIWGNKIKEKKKYNLKNGKHSKENEKKQNKKDEDNWENEFIKIDKKDKKKKKKGFFDKFKK